MFNDLKGGWVRLKKDGRARTVNIAVFNDEPALYVKCSGAWYSVMRANGSTLHEMHWDMLHLPKTWERIADSGMGYVQVQSIAVKTRKRLTGK